MNYQSFLSRLQKKGSKPHKIAHCLGVRDAWKWVRKNKWEALNYNHCDSKLYSTIINKVHQAFVEYLINGHTIDFPHQMGGISICSYPSKVIFVNGKVSNNYRADWKKTLKLWFEDEEAFKSRIVVKRRQNNIYFIRYNKNRAKYHNMKLYQFRANRSLVRKVGKAIEEGAVRAMHLNN